MIMRKKYVASQEMRDKAKALRHTRNGAIQALYNNQKYSCKIRGMEPPPYTIAELREWVLARGYQELFDAWKESGFKKILAPSVDRIDCNKNYSFDNMRLVTWHENVKKVGLDNFRKPRSTNTSGVSGVHRNEHAEYKSGKPWTVAFRVNGKRYYLGIFKTMEEAIAVRLKWVEDNHDLLYPGL